MSEFRYSKRRKGNGKSMATTAVVKSHCRMCHGGCGVLVYTKNGRVAKIAGDPDCPIKPRNPVRQRASLPRSWPITRTA